MKPNCRTTLRFLTFLAILSLAVSSQSQLLDEIMTYVFWTALVIGSAVAVVKNWRSRDAVYYGQASVLPQRWQLWLGGESTSKPETHPTSLS
jgi:hypothetical protein